jgi:predicted Ser/Thr protein kinase
MALARTVTSSPQYDTAGPADPTVVASSRGTSAPPPLEGSRLKVARGLWAAIALLSACVFLAGIPGRVNVLLNPADVLRDQLAGAGISIGVYAAFITIRELVFVAAFAAIGVVIFWRRSTSGVAIFTSIVFITFAASFFAAYRIVFIESSPVLYTLARVVLIIGFGSAPVLIYTFPDGRFVPSWLRYATVVWLGVILLQFPTHEGLFVYVDGVRRVLPTTLASYALFLLLALYGQIFRYRRYADGAARQQTKWVVVGFITGILGLVLWYGSQLVFPLDNDPLALRMLRLLVGETLYLFAFIAIPLGMAFSILRYRLYDINLLVSRGIVFALLTAFLVAVFAATQIGLRALLELILGGEQDVNAAIVATAVVVALFAPTRRRIQRQIDVRFFRAHMRLTEQAARDQITLHSAGALSGQVIGDYTLGRLLGRGGMGEVYLATQNSLKRQVAIKLLPHDLAARPEMKARFEREAQVIAAIRHPNIVSVYNFGEHEGMLYIVMEYLDGELLSHAIRGKRLKFAEALAVLRDIAAALDHAHARALVHRDVKPSNIMLMRDGDGQRAMLMDFGIAKIIAEGTGITSTGMLGTIDYAAPEQIMSAADVDHRADIYSLGVVAYQMLTGWLPFSGLSPGQVLYAHLQQAPADPRTIAPELSESVSAAIRRAMEKSPEKRPASAGAFVEMLGGK